MPLSSLTSKQREVVEWLVENDYDDEPARAVEAKMISGTSLYNKWGVDTVRQWCAAYRQTLPPPPMTEAQVQARLQAMMPAAMATLQQTLVQGRGDRVANDLAKWIIKEACAPPPSQRAQPEPRKESQAVSELRNVLEFVSK